MIRTCTIHDIPALLKLTKDFIGESGWGFTFDHETAARDLLEHIESELCVIYLAEVENIPAGYAICIASTDFTLEKQGFLHKFYIAPDFRKTTLPRQLSRQCAKWFDAQDCLYSFTTSTARIGKSIKTFANLLSKDGFTECGPCMVRA